MFTSEFRQEIVEYSRTFLNVKWRHQGRTQNGLDCIGFIIVIAEHFNLERGDLQGYTRGVNGNKFVSEIRNHSNRKPILDRLPGDILLMRDTIMPCHAALVVDYDTIIHSSIHNKGVKEERIIAYSSLITHCLEFRQV
jgi:cell wall-associated NlpC family hydrolase